MSNSADISVVVQGPVVGLPDAPKPERKTLLALESIRRVLPDAEIILSTWKGAVVTGLPYDVLVESEDPGSFPRGDGSRYNVNRQIVSTREGLKRATRSRALKLRTDCQLLHEGFLRYFARFPRRAARHRYFFERIVGCELFFRNPAETHLPLLFHIGDIALFGRTDDMLSLWDVEFATEDEVVNWSARATVPWLENFKSYQQFDSRLVEEQHLWLSFLRKKRAGLNLNYSWEFTPDLAQESELTIINNFVVIGIDDFGLHLPARLRSPVLYPLAVYSHQLWLALYDECCPAASVDARIDQRRLLFEKLKKRRIINYHVWRLLEAERQFLAQVLKSLGRLRAVFRLRRSSG
jgi:hypothetical protein